MSAKRRVFATVGAVIIGSVTLLILDSKRDYYDRLPPIGEAIPSFDLPMNGGGRLTSSSFSGRPVVLALWSSDCFASRLALRGLASIDRDYARHGVRVAVLADDSDATVLQSVLDSANVSVPVAYAAGTLDDLFDGARRPWQKSFPLPTYLLIDGEGRLVRIAMGVPLDEVRTDRVRLENLRSAIDAALVGGSTPPMPRTGNPRTRT